MSSKVWMWKKNVDEKTRNFIVGKNEMIFPDGFFRKIFFAGIMEIVENMRWTSASSLEWFFFYVLMHIKIT